jgi:hypothetical protein
VEFSHKVGNLQQHSQIVCIIATNDRCGSLGNCKIGIDVFTPGIAQRSALQKTQMDEAT